MNGYFVEAVICEDEITLMGPTPSSIMSLLNECDAYARKHYIVFNPVKTNCTSPPHHLLTLFQVKCCYF